MVQSHPMPPLLALLRGINVGGHRKLPMADLRDLAAKLGFRDARTYVQSGNLVFATDLRPGAAAVALEQGIAKRFGFPVDVVVRTAVQWARDARGNPFIAASQKEPHRVMLLLSKAPPRVGGVTALVERAMDGERVEGVGEAVWVHYPEGQARTRLSPALIDRLLGSPTTARNWKTVLALQAMLDGAD